jgi:hypothetical protein
MTRQTVTQTNEATFGDDTAELDVSKVAVPIAVPINVEEDDHDGTDDDDDDDD